MEALLFFSIGCNIMFSLFAEHGAGKCLDWSARLNIALGTARGLAYLHHDCCPKIVHCNIKSSNILLDENLEAHVADFGLAKLSVDGDSHITTVVAGTFGYLAPGPISSIVLISNNGDSTSILKL